jgi:hypothetical protein
MLFPPNLLIASPNNEEHIFESKDLENNKLKCQPPSHAWNNGYTNLYNVVDSNGFDVSNLCITYVMGILLLPNYVNGTYEYIATWINKHYVQQWM